MISRTVAFDSGDVAAWRIRIHDAQVNAELRNSHLRVHNPATRLKRDLDRVLERGVGAAVHRGKCLTHGSGAALDALFSEYADHPPPALHYDNVTAIVLRFQPPPARPRENIDETALPAAAIGT